MTTEAERRAMLEPVFYTDVGPIPAWFVNGVAEAMRLPCDCALSPYDHKGHAPGCRAGEAWVALMARAREDASDGVNGDLTS
jgi:hypothetical protein